MHLAGLVVLSAAPAVTSAATSTWASVERLGGLVGPIAEHLSPNGLRGLKITAAVEEGAMLLQVPRRCFLTSDDMVQTHPSIGSLPLSAHGAHACLLLDRSRSGDLEPALTAPLPAAFVPGPTWLWEKTQISALASPWLIQASQLMSASARQEFDAVASSWSTLELGGTGSARPTFDEWQWALATVTTRTLHGAKVDGDGEGVLAPLADLMNHDPSVPPTVTVQLEGPRGSDALTVRAATHLEAGTEITFHYGTSLSNAELLLQYGELPAPRTQVNVRTSAVPQL